MSNEETDESSVIRELRKQLKASEERLSTLEPLARKLAFTEAGVDLSSKSAQFFASKYDGDLDAEAIRAAATEHGFVSEAATNTPPPVDGTQRRMDDLRSQSMPEGSGKKLSFKDWSQLSKDDPQAAMSAHAEGLVDFPSHMTPHLAAPAGAA